MRYTIIFLVLLLSGCSSVTKNMELATEGSAQSEVIIFRPSEFAGGGGDMLVGLNERYFGALSNKQFMKVKVNSGEYNFIVKANGSSASSLRVNLKPNTTVCLKSNINPSVAGVAIIPLAANLVSWFQLSEVPCPDQEFFAEYTEAKKS